MIYEEQLKEWEQLANEATEGPWSNTSSRVTAEKHPNPISVCFLPVPESTAIADAAFIAAAREAVPALIARVRQLEAEADWLASHVRNGESTCVDTVYGVETCTSECLKCWREAARKACNSN